MNFTHLHCHDGEGSILDSTIFVKELPKRAKELGMSAVATTNHGVLYSSVDFYIACKQQDIKPIMGCEFYICPDMKEHDPKNRYTHLIILAKNKQGWENIKLLCTKGILEGQYYKPRIDFELLKQYNEGLIITSACLGGELPKMITDNKDYSEYLSYVNKYKEVFGDDFYLEIQSADNNEQELVNKTLIQLSEETGVKLIATSDVHFLYREDYELHGTFTQISHGRDNEFYTDCWFKNEDEMLDVLKKHIGNVKAVEAMTNTQEIVDKCNVELDLGHSYLPSVILPEQFDNDIAYIKNMISNGFVKKGYNKYPNKTEYIDRINYEMKIIIEKGFVGYFLILADLIQDCKKDDVPMAPGRGSSGGSLVADLLEITDIDPIKYGLDFGRFLTMERTGLPDIDIDVASSTRYDVIHMVREKYGAENVAQIMTFGCLQSRAILSAVGKVLNYDIPTIDQIKKELQDGIRIEDSLLNNPEIMAEHRQLINYCARLEGLPRSTSLHAGGVVICPQGHKMTEYAPMMISKEGELAVQCTKKTVEKVGLVKYDILATLVLDIVADCIKSIGQTFYSFNWNYDDEKVWDYICTGKTQAMFQTESNFMTEILLKIQPRSIEELCAVISLGRPDTMGEVDPYVAVKTGQKDPVYYDVLLKPTLEGTYGMMIYQETFMNIAKVYAGYTDGQADDLRKGLGLKDKKLVKAEADKFYDKSIDLGRPPAICRQLADILAEKGGYCFNKSHGIAYSIISYWTAYLKYYYPLEFMASVLNNQRREGGQVDYDGVAQYITAARDMGITILPPDINTTNTKFTINKESNSVVFGFNLLKGVSKKCIESLEKDGPYTSFEDYVERTGLSLNKTDTISLIKCGSFNSISKLPKKTMFKYFYSKRFDGKLEEVKPLTRINKNNVQFILDNGLASPTEVEDKELCLTRINKHRKSAGWVEFEKKYMAGTELNWEMQTLNTFLSGDPFDGVILPDWSALNIGDFGTLGGVITGVKKLTIKKGKSSGQKMAFINLKTDYGIMDIVAFASAFSNYEDMMVVGNTITVMGEKTDELNCTMSEALTLGEYLVKTKMLYKEKK